MNLSRRQFFEVSGKGVIGLAIAEATLAGGAAFVLVGCNITIQDVANWTNMGADALGTVLTVLGALGIVCAPCVVAAPIAIAAIHAIAGAITEWENAPVSDKTTLWGKIHTALVAAFDQVTAFLQSANIPMPGIVSMVVNIGSLILSTIAGFIAKFFPGAVSAMQAKRPTLGQTTPIPVTPKVYSPADFKKAFNKVVTDGGHAEVSLH